MSKPVNPFTIGAFLLGSFTLLIAAILIFAGGEFFKPKREYVIFFDSSMNGLNVGAPVKLDGVQIGTVKSISLVYNDKHLNIIKPVVVEINPDSFQEPSGASLAWRPQSKSNTERLINAGLKARLEMQSLLTGLLYVEFKFDREKPVNLTGINYKDIPELPSLPTTTDEIRNTADEIMTRIRKLPLEDIMNDLAATLHEVRDLMKSDDTKQSIAALAQTLEETRKLTKTLNASIGPILNNANGTLSESRHMVKETRKEMVTVMKNLDKSLTTATQVLNESQHAVNAVEMLAAPDSALGQTLVEMRDASRSIKDLTDYLERQPDSLLFGKE